MFKKFKEWKYWYYNNAKFREDYFILYADIEARIGFELVSAVSKRHAIKQLKKVCYAKHALVLIIKVFKRK